MPPCASKNVLKNLFCKKKNPCQKWPFADLERVKCKLELVSDDVYLPPNAVNSNASGLGKSIGLVLIALIIY